jgi:hypothetical protein
LEFAPGGFSGGKGSKGADALADYYRAFAAYELAIARGLNPVTAPKVEDAMPKLPLIP